MDESQRHYAKKKKELEGFMLYNLMYVTFGKKKNYKNKSKSMIPGIRVGTRGW